LYSILLICFTNAQHCTPGLDCWLQSRTIPITDTSFTQNQQTLYIQQINCNNITVPSLTSSLPSDLNVRLSTTGVGLTCIANWNLYTPSTNYSGTLNVMVSDVSISLALELIANATYGFVGGIDANCTFIVPNVALQFNNAPDVSQFQAAVKGYLAAQIRDTSCSYITETTDNGVMDTFAALNTWAAGELTQPLGMEPRIKQK
jgi:hypothetical protein